MLKTGMLKSITMTLAVALFALGLSGGSALADACSGHNHTGGTVLGAGGGCAGISPRWSIVMGANSTATAPPAAAQTANGNSADQKAPSGHAPNVLTDVKAVSDRRII